MQDPVDNALLSDDPNSRQPSSAYRKRRSKKQTSESSAPPLSKPTGRTKTEGGAAFSHHWLRQIALSEYTELEDRQVKKKRKMSSATLKPPDVTLNNW